MDRIWAEHPHTTLTACGESVGLPAGQMGNSEVGHLNLGAGAIVPQDLARIDKAVEDGTLGDSEVLGELMDGAERLHLIGLVSDGGVHSSDRHLKALVELAAVQGRARRRRARVHGRPRHLAQGRREVPRRRRGARRRARGLGDRALLRDGPRRPLGPGPEGLRPARARQGRAPRRQRRAGREGRLRARRDRRVHRRDDGRRGGRRSARATRCWASTSGRTACARSRARWRRTASARSTAAGARSSSATRRWPSTTRTGTTPSSSRPSARRSRSRR